MPGLRPIRCLSLASALVLGHASGAAAAPLTLLDELKQGGLEVVGVRVTPQGAARPIGHDLRFKDANDGRDTAGAFKRSRYTLVPSPYDPAAAADGVKGTLMVQRYANGVVTCALEYDGPPLAERHAIQVQLQPHDFTRGLEIARYNPFWTGPAFVSDYRQWPEHGAIALWQRADTDDYQLLAPLSGAGMVGEVGVAEDRFGVITGSGMAFSKGLVPLFAYATGGDPYGLPRLAYETAFAEQRYDGRLRWQKPYPEAYRRLGWCSWNAYYDKVTEADVLASAQSLKERGAPVASMLVDDGWLASKDRRLVSYDADPVRFPHGLGWLASTLRRDFGMAHVGVWHAFQGYWWGVDANSDIGKAHALFTANDGLSIPDPRGAAGTSFYDDWYERLAADGIDFIKVDNQGATASFVDRRLPLFDAAGGAEAALQAAASRHFGLGGGANVLNCMAERPELVYHWRESNLVRTSNDYEPDLPLTSQEHIFQNAYNTFWLSSFAYPDFDMFVSDRPDAEFHAIARAVSGGPAYIADRPGHENVALLKQLAFDDGRLLQPDAPAEPTLDSLLKDVSLEASPLKLWAPVLRPGFQAAVIAAFHVNKSLQFVPAVVSSEDAPGFEGSPLFAYGKGKVVLVDGLVPGMPGPKRIGFVMQRSEARIFSTVKSQNGAAVLGLIDKFVGVAAVTEVKSSASRLEFGLAGPGDAGVLMTSAPKAVRVDGHLLTSAQWHYADELFSVSISGKPDSHHSVVLER